MLNLELYKANLKSLFRRVQSLLDTHQGILLDGNPLENEYLTAWYLSKNDGVTLIKSLDDCTGRPILLFQDGVFTAYWFKAQKWYQLGTTDDHSLLGTKLRRITETRNFNHKCFNKIITLKNIDYSRLAPELIIEKHRVLNALGVLLSRWKISNTRYGINDGWLNLTWSRYLKEIEKTNAVLVDKNLPINHFTIAWNKL